MDHSLSYVVHSHLSGFFIVAALVGLIGSGLTIGLLVRSRGLNGRRHLSHLALGTLIAGSTIWAAHFIAMLGYRPAGEMAYEPFLTGLTLILAIVGCGLSIAMFSSSRLPRPTILGGSCFGLTISAMHYIGMQAVQVPGHFMWRPEIVTVSVIVGCLLGVIMVHHILKPVSRYRWVGGTLAMVLSVCAMHFIGMAAMIFMPDANAVVPEQNISHVVLGFIVVIVVGLILLIGIATFFIEAEMSVDTQRRLSDAVRHDLLTGLPNRLAFQEHIAHLQKRFDAGQITHITVYSLDLDDFKKTNDTFGHSVGDQILCHVADQLRGMSQDKVFFARIGGDDFAVVRTSDLTWDDTNNFAGQLMRAIETPVSIGERDIRLGAIIGVAMCPENGKDVDALLGKADLAMSRSQEDATGNMHFYDNEIETVERDKMMLLADLRSAIAQGTLTLNYQLQNSLVTREAIGFEALARWMHPQRGAISPAEFIPLAEEAGLIRDLGLWVLRTACSEASSWDFAYPIAVNVSPVQLNDPGFASCVADILRQSGLTPDRLEIEITEDSIIDDQERALAMMHQLKSMGIGIAMDDFGTGYSSLATLRVFPFDKIKIDRSFVRDVHLSRQNAAIVRATVLLGDALNVPVLAEGAETEDELAFLAQEHCDAVQGFFFGKPMDVATVRLQTMQSDRTKRAV